MRVSKEYFSCFIKIIICGFISASISVASGSELRIYRPELSKQIENLDLEEFPPFEILEDGSTKPAVEISILGTFYRPGWTLISDSESKVILDGSSKKTKISHPFRLTKKLTQFRLIAVSEFGQVQSEEVLIDFSKWDELRSGKPFWPSVNSNLWIVLAPTYEMYEETAKSDLTVYALTGKVSYETSLFKKMLQTERLRFGANFSFTLLPISSSSVSNISARWVRLNSTLGYIFTPETSRYKLAVIGGFHSQSMLVSNGDFGYSYLMGPQIGLQGGMDIRGSRIQGYFRYSLISQELMNLSSTSNGEIGCGIAWKRWIAEKHPVSFQVDFTSLSLTSETFGADARSKSISLGIGYGFL